MADAKCNVRATVQTAQGLSEEEQAEIRTTLVINTNQSREPGHEFSVTKT